MIEIEDNGRAPPKPRPRPEKWIAQHAPTHGRCRGTFTMTARAERGTIVRLTSPIAKR